MQTGKIEANLVNLNREFNLPYINAPIAQKTTRSEKTILENIDLKFHQQEYNRLSENLKTVFNNSYLPEIPSAKEALNDLLVRLRIDS